MASCTKSRPFKGRSATCCEVITWPSVASVVCTPTAVADYLHAGLHRCRRQLEIQLAMLIHLQPYVLGFSGLKTLLLHMDGVIAYAQ